MSTIKYIFAIVLCAVVLLPLVFSVEGSQEFPITTNESHQRSPAIYGNIVVYEDNRKGNWDIYGYNLTTQKEFQITKDLKDQLNPAIYQDIVVYEDHRIIEDDTSGFTFDGIISGYNLTTDEEFQIITTPYWELNPAWTVNLARKSHPALYGDIVVWVDHGIEHSHIAGYNLETHEAFQIAEIPDKHLWPALYQDIVVWQDNRDHSFIYGYNLSTKEEFKIGTEDRFPFPIHFRKNPAIHNDIVVWTESDDDIIYGYNLVTHEEFLIGTASLNECPRQYRFGSSNVESRRPRIYNDIVIWVDFRNGNEDIYGYNLSTDEEFQVTTNGTRQHSPALSNTIVVWQDNRNGNWDIYGADISSPLITTSMSKTKALRDLTLDIFRTLLFWILLAAPIVLFVSSVARSIWYWRMKKVSDTSKTLSPGQPTDFKRNALSTFPFVWLAALYAYVGYDDIINLELSFASLVFFACTAFCVGYFFWSKRTPYIRITHDEIVLSKFMHSPIVINLDVFQKMNVQTWMNIPYEVDLILSDKTKEKITHHKLKKIGLLSLNEKDKEGLIQTLRQIIEDSLAA